uniref:Uncharacterized protein n=1 Tax=Phaeomonas parva TaxID=124430 RepID=A0A7S1XSU4_9STRA
MRRQLRLDLGGGGARGGGLLGPLPAALLRRRAARRLALRQALLAPGEVEVHGASEKYQPRPKATLLTRTRARNLPALTLIILQPQQARAAIFTAAQAVLQDVALGAPRFGRGRPALGA